MIWFFLAGFISGFIGCILFTKWCINHAEMILDVCEVDDDDERSAADQGHMDGTV